MLPAQPLKTYIVEDSRVIRENLIATLEELVPVEVVGTAEDEASAVRWLGDPANHADLLIVDIFLKTGTGLGVLRAANVVVDDGNASSSRLKSWQRIVPRFGEFHDMRLKQVSAPATQSCSACGGRGRRRCCCSSPTCPLCTATLNLDARWRRRAPCAWSAASSIREPGSELPAHRNAGDPGLRRGAPGHRD